MTRSNMRRNGFLFAFCVLVAGSIAACAPSSRDVASSDRPDGNVQPVAFNQSTSQTCPLSELAELGQRRETDDSGDFSIGPGDVINVSVPEVEELQHQKVRVSSDGRLSLSLIGTLDVTGMDENQLREAIVRRLSKFMKYPRVDLFVDRYQTREVAVIGAVQKPGEYVLPDMNESIMEMIGRAGGMTADSAQKVIFVPAEQSLRHQPELNTPSTLQVASRTGLGNSSYHSASLEDAAQRSLNASGSDVNLRTRAWIDIDLSNPQSHACLNIPTRPGDVIIVPIAGQVMVQGWVKNPGAFKITPGMTVLGAVSAAGGAEFSQSAELLRTDSAGKHVAAQFNLSELASGDQKDVPLQSGDVVIVEPSIVGAIPFAMLQVLSRFGAGMYLPVP